MCVVIHGKYYYNGHTRHKAVYTVNLCSYHPQWSKNASGGNTIAAHDPRAFSNYGQCHMQHMTDLRAFSNYGQCNMHPIDMIAT